MGKQFFDFLDPIKQALALRYTWDIFGDFQPFYCEIDEGIPDQILRIFNNYFDKLISCIPDMVPDT